MAAMSASASAEGADAADERPISLLMLHNVSKKKNFGELLRSAAAMGVSEVVVVGAAKLATHGAQGTAGHLRFSHFNKFADAVAYARDVKKCALCGVEITEGAAAVQRHPFRGSTCFLMGNEGHGLTDAQLAACDHFVYIPQHSGATASLNVLHHFAIWAALPEAPREGYKYSVDAPGQSVARSGVGIKQMRTLNADGSVAPRVRRGDDGEGSGEEALDVGGCGSDKE